MIASCQPLDLLRFIVGNRRRVVAVGDFRMFERSCLARAHHGVLSKCDFNSARFETQDFFEVSSHHLLRVRDLKRTGGVENFLEDRHTR